MKRRILERSKTDANFGLSTFRVVELCHRSRRVTLLVLGIMILSFADLVVTLAYLKAHWMMEANPIAAYLISSTQSPWALVAFKGASVGICVALLYRVRHCVAAEIAAWCALCILAGMSLMWHTYSAHFDNPEEMLMAQMTIGDDPRIGLP